MSLLRLFGLHCTPAAWTSGNIMRSFYRRRLDNSAEVVVSAGLDYCGPDWLDRMGRVPYHNADELDAAAGRTGHRRAVTVWHP